MQQKMKTWRSELFSVPNLLSYLRLAMIPFICMMYKQQRYLGTTILVVLSGMTDLLDGYIARHYDMITDLGKIVDPIADKLTQLALVLLLIDRYPWFIYLVLLLVIKDVFMGIMGLVVLHKKQEVYGAIWCGKLATMTFYLVMVVLLFFPHININVAGVLSMLCGSMMLLSLMVYTVYDIKLLLEK